MNKPRIRSSYIPNNYGRLFQTLISITKPEACVEIGVLDGYSTVHIGLALKSLGTGHLYAYDLFEDYPYNNMEYKEVLSRIKRLDLSNEVTLRKRDIMEASSDFGISSIDFMHVDISNSGRTIRNVLTVWDEKIKPGGMLIFEGGSPIRDEISWMNKFNKEKIFPELKDNIVLNTNYTYVVLHPFPSLIVCSKHLDYCSMNWIEFGYDKEKDRTDISEDDLFNDE